ncbi:MAG: pyruvate kinase alpha/beta domain-containing protein [Erysipelotrichaceae bacterium]
MYFIKEGVENTQQTIELGIRTAIDRNIKTLVIATTSGYVVDFIPKDTNLNIVFVTTAYGSKLDNACELADDKRDAIKANGYHLVCAAHALSGAQRGISKKYGGISDIEIIANTLRMFSQGTKVCVEIAAMAADAGEINVNEQVVVMGGSSHGLDTALILRPMYSAKILLTKIDEIVCKPIVD